MDTRSSTLDAAIRAIQAETDLNVVWPAIDDVTLAWFIALAQDAHPIIRTIAALRSGFIDLLDARIFADPDIQTAMVRLIGTREGKKVIDPWAQIAFAGWGRPHTVALINAVNNKTCSASAAAVLIGPCDVSASLLHDEQSAARAIRHWGQSSPNAPTAWMHALSAGERDRLLDDVQPYPSAVACCLPWLPPDRANQVRLDDESLGAAIDAFVAASSTARAQHADLLQRLVAQAQPANLDALTRLACATRSKSVWRRVRTLIQKAPNAAHHVVTAAPWDSLAKTVRTAIFEHADQADICANIAAAQGNKDIERITHYSAIAFLAALDPKAWNALPAAEQRRLLDDLGGGPCLSRRAVARSTPRDSGEGISQ